MREFDDAFESALARVEAAKNFDELRSAVHELLAPYNLRHAVYHAIRLPLQEKEHPLLVFTYPEEWIKHYFEKKYYRIDPVVIQGEGSIIPIDWGRLDKSPRPVKALFAEADDAGLGRQGLTFPIRGALGDTAIFTITSDVDDLEWEKIRSRYLRDMQILGNYIHAITLRISGVKLPDYISRLSRRERECLQWAAVGETIASTADKLHWSERELRGYLDSARHKLDCLTKPQAVAKAIALGILHPY